jgi:hypothetical protein
LGSVRTRMRTQTRREKMFVQDNVLHWLNPRN